METSLGKKYITQLGPKPQDFADWFDLFWNTYVSDILLLSDVLKQFYGHL